MDATSCFQEGQCLYEQKEYEKACEKYEQATEIKPEFFEFYRAHFRVT